MISKIIIGDNIIKCRKEDFGYTIFDGNLSIQVNNTFYYILKCLAAKLNKEEIVSKLMETFDTQKMDKNIIEEDIKYVVDYAKNKNWTF